MKKILLIVVFSGLVLRLVKLAELFYFTFDEEVYSFVVKQIVANHKLTLIGAVTPLGIHLPPFFYYFSAIPFYTFRLNPLGWGIWSGLITTIALLLVYKVGRIFFGKRVGFLAAILMSFSWLMIFFDRHYWALTFGPILSLVTLLCLYKIKQGHFKFSPVLSLSLLLAVSSDLSGFTLIIFTLLVWKKWQLPFRKKEIFISILIFILGISTVFIFDLRHNFYNTKKISNFLQRNGKNSSVSLSKFGESLSLVDETISRSLLATGDLDLAKQHSYCPKYVTQKRNDVSGLMRVISTLIVVAFFYTVWKKRKNEPDFSQILALLFLTHVVLLIFYASLFKPDLYEQYLALILPTFFIMTAIVLNNLLKKEIILGTIMGIFVVLNLYNFSRTYNTYGFAQKIAAAKFAIEQVGNREFFLEAIGTCFAYAGYRYPFYLLGKEPLKSYVDNDLSWLYDRKPVEYQPKIRVIFVSPDFDQESSKFYESYNMYKNQEFASKKFGNLEVLILEAK